MDKTENLRKQLSQIINSNPLSRGELETSFGEVWDTQELQNAFEVEGFLAPFVVVMRKSDRQRGTLMFQHWPRFYFKFAAERP